MIWEPHRYVQNDQFREKTLMVLEKKPSLIIM
jgi:hypothetical protein